MTILASADAAAVRANIAAAPLAAPAFTGQVSVPLGSAAAPSIIPTGDPNTGLFSPGADLLAVALGGTERLRLDAGYLRLAAASGGIQFNGDTLAANALNDYEEGSWTPVIAGATLAGVGTYTLQTGRYVKVGKVVSVWGAVTTTGHTGTGQMVISALPFVAANVANMKYVANLAYLNLTTPTNSQAIGFLQANENWILMQSLPTTGGSHGYSALTIDVACTINFSITYEAA